MKITVLGCGSSGGVPLIGNDWGKCDPKNPRNLRKRVSILVEQGDTTLIVDTGPDFREQALACNLQKLDAVLYTHAHADHTHGIDDLRSVNWLTQKPIPIYGDKKTLDDLALRFDYIFAPRKSELFYRPVINAHEISGLFSVGNIDVKPFYQNHGYTHSIGFRFGDFAYSTDVHTLDDTAWETLRGVKIWLVDCVREEPHPTHSHLSQTLEWIKKLKPDQAYLTHMSQKLDYDTLCATLPAGVKPAYDGMVIEC